MFQMTKKTGYGLIATAYLARRATDRPISAKDIAETFGLSQPLIMNVLKKLSSAGCVKSVRGARGGYKLAYKPEKISLEKIITALEGSVHLTRCSSAKIGRDKQPCNLFRRCPIIKSISRLEKQFNDLLRKTTLSEFAKGICPPGKDF